MKIASMVYGARKRITLTCALLAPAAQGAVSNAPQPVQRVIGHAPWEHVAHGAMPDAGTPFIYFGEVAIPDHTCEEWFDAFNHSLDGIDGSRIAGLQTSMCWDEPGNRRIVYDGVVEPWTSTDTDYLNGFIATRQGYDVLGTKLRFLKTKGVILDFAITYEDANGRTIPQWWGVDESLTLGSNTVHGVAFDFDAAGAALDRPVGEGLLPYIEATFGAKERLIADKLYLPEAKVVDFGSTLRFLLMDFSAHAMPYWGHSKEL